MPEAKLGVSELSAKNADRFTLISVLDQALSNHPALKAVSPQAPVTEWFIGDDFHHNGAFMLADGFAFYAGFGKPRPKPTTVGPTGFNFTNPDNFDFYLQTGAITNFTKLMGDSIKFWNDLMAHPNYDEFWQIRNARKHVEDINPNIATLIVGGLYDAEDCFGAWNLYKAIETKAKNNNKLVMGPWYHGQWASNDGTQLGNVQWGSNTSEWYGKNIELPFFNFYLKNKGSIACVLPDGSSQRVLEEAWHLSYPYVWEENEQIYLLPESADSGKLYRYRAEDFPKKWVRESIFFEGEAYDPTLLKKDGLYWLFVNQKAHSACSPFDELFLYYTDDIQNPTWQAHPVNPIVSDVRCSRPAGRIFEKDGKWFRPAQDSGLRYGHRIQIQEILVLTKEAYQEVRVQTLEPDSDSEALGIHTLNFGEKGAWLDFYYRR